MCLSQVINPNGRMPLLARGDCRSAPAVDTGAAALHDPPELARRFHP
jgi:hypothetical protein